MRQLGMEEEHVVDSQGVDTTILLASHAAEDIEVLCDKVYEMEMGVCTPWENAQK